MRGFLERLVFGQREHHDRLVTFARDSNRRVVLTDPVDGVRKVLSRLGVSNRLQCVGQDTVQSAEFNCGVM